MAAANSSGVSSPAGGAGAGGDSGGGAGDYGKLSGFLAAEVDCCGSSNPAANVDCYGSSNPAVLKFSSPEKAAAVAAAKVWKEHTAKSSRWTSRFLGGMKLDDDLWDVRFNLDGQDNLEHSLCKSDITYLNLLALIEGEGYGMDDNMYFVKEKNRGIAGMKLLDGMRKSKNMNKGKQILDVEEETAFPEEMQGGPEEMEEDGDDMDEDEAGSESDEAELNQRLIDPEVRKRGASVQLCEAEAEAEDLFCDSDCSDDDSLDGCFIKLSTGQQILCATGRDGKNNLFPISFGFVDKEETATWSWFLTQLKYAVGGEARNFGYYTIISDWQKENRGEPTSAPPSATAPPQSTAAPTPAAAARPPAAPTAPIAAKNKAPTPAATSAPPTASAGRAPQAKKKAPAPSANSAPTSTWKTARSASSRPAQAFKAPRPAQAPPAATSTTGRPAKERKESSRMKGYLTASNIDNLTLQDIKNVK
ncbi:hypothetical protein ACQ4PT_012281 [Festuca glaucescens]